MRILVFEHGATEHAGGFRRLFAEDGHAVTAVRLDLGAPIPALDAFDALWVMGGVMNVWEEAAHPWLAAEKAAIREAVIERDLAFFGVCLGHQLAAEVLGGRVGRAAAPEIGVRETRLTAAGRADPALRDAPPRFPALHWHEAEVSALPDGAAILAETPDCANQAMRCGPRVFSTQFHIEAEADTFENWTQSRSAQETLTALEGPAARARHVAACRAAAPEITYFAERVYRHWSAAV